MKTKFKFGDTKIKHFLDGIKTFEKYTGVNRHTRDKTVDYLNILPAYGHDTGNYFARFGLANFQIQAVMKLDGILDFNKLSSAARLSVDAEPVLGCRFVEGDPPYWKRLDDIDNVKFCFFEETDNPDEAVKRFLEGPLDMDKGPVFKVKLIRSGPYDTLCVKVNHVCCDGAGAKEFIQLLSNIYSRIDCEGGIFVPEPSIRSRRDHDRLFSAFGINDLKKAWNPLKELPISSWKFPWKNGRRGATRFAVCRLPHGQLDHMNNYAKARGATINDLLLAAIYRAMFGISKPPYGVPMDIPVTIDLRRYLPDKKAEAIRNLTGGIIIRIARKAHEPFEGTLCRVMSATKEIKNGHPGVQHAIWAELAEKMSFRKVCAHFKTMAQGIELASQNPFYTVDKCGLALSNFGFISRPLIKFGENVVTDAYIIPPVIRAPGILLVVSTYNGIITLAVGYYKPSISRRNMERLLRKIKDELMEGCV